MACYSQSLSILQSQVQELGYLDLTLLEDQKEALASCCSVLVEPGTPQLPNLNIAEFPLMLSVFAFFNEIGF